MAKIQEILEIEKQRETQSEMCTIHLFQEGSFCRGYQMSAWLCVKYLHGFKVNNHSFKSIEEPVTFIGFPLSSMSKWIPDGVELLTAEDKHFVVDLSVLIGGDGKTPEERFAEYLAWKEGLPVEESTGNNKKEAPSQKVPDCSVSLSSVAHTILAYPLEQKSPIDCMLFVAELKKQLASIF